jgi:adenosine deaminase
LEIAIQSGSVRIGDGINSLQRIEFLCHNKNVCFEKNPTTNLLLGYSGDSRSGSAPVLLGLGFPVTINSDDPGKFRLEDATSDYFLAAISYKWRLRHLKLIGLHALNHSICPRGQKLILE